MSEQESKIIRMTEEELKDNKLKRSINYSEDIEKEIDFLFGNKIGAVYNYGRDILFDVCLLYTSRCV